MMLKKLELHGFKSFAQKTVLVFDSPITAIVGPNGSGKSNTVEALRFVLGEQSQKSLRSKTGADLIFKGSKGRNQSKEASVFLTFDNTNRTCAVSGDDGKAIPIDTDTVTIGRSVSVEGGNEYTINGSSVRLRDIHDMIARLNIGSSGHHIISQGEADRLLYSKPKDRKDMLEESLGLRLFQHRLKEADRKMERTRALVGEVEIMKREVAPQVRFLKKQVEKIQKAEETAIELRVVWDTYSKTMEHSFGSEEQSAKHRLSEIGQKLASISERETRKQNPLEAELAEVQSKEHELSHRLKEVENTIGVIERGIGRTEGALEMFAHQMSKQPEHAESSEMVSVSRKKAEMLIGEIKELHRMLEEGTIELSAYSGSLSKFLERFDEILGTSKASDPVVVDHSQKHELEKTLHDLVEQKENSIGERAKIEAEILSLRAQAGILREQFFEEEKEHQATMFEGSALKHEKETLEKLVARIEEERSLVASDTERVRHMTQFVSMKSAEGIAVPEGLGSATEMRRYAERLIARIEDSGAGGGGDVITEYDALVERETFLDKELADLKKAEEDLVTLQTELRGTIEESFESGIKRINTAFSELFKAMFGGGDAKLLLVAPEAEEAVEGEEAPAAEARFDGVEIDVKLPRKKVTDIEMLSGGERSLTSIALLFALSAVNPPPFLVLDETDAALDEANSKKYGDMVERLSEQTQLVVVTHNRETMSRAQTLYGVTLGTDDSSMLLTVKFEEAVAVAK